MAVKMSYVVAVWEGVLNSKSMLFCHLAAALVALHSAYLLEVRLYYLIWFYHSGSASKCQMKKGPVAMPPDFASSPAPHPKKTK